MEKEAVLDLVPQLKPTDHAIMFYEYPEDKYRVLFDYLKAGLDSQEAVAYVAGIDETPSQVRNLMQKRGIDADLCEKKGMLQIMSYKDWYLIGGEFNVQRTIALWARLLGDALADGFKGLRVAGDTTWFFKCDMKEKLLEYENSLHRVLDVPLIAICAYSLPVLMQQDQVQLVVDLIKAHNNVIFLGSQAGLVKAREISNL
ncbi:MAG TPA: MEDS domain-containing protein [Candidatus Bathyarchaeia archaeon]|nr:MEDS domain-containing protein [Candidatus Bathyarchaeia archaeon]